MAINVDLAKRIGSIVLFVGSCFAGELERAILSSRRKPLSVVPVGKPFIVRISKEGGKPFEQAPKVKGLEQVSFMGKSFGSNTFSAGRRILHETYAEYTVVADEPGTLTLGPAKINGMRSNTVTVTVEKDEAHPLPKVSITLNTAEAYVGQKVPFTYCFSWHNPEIRPLRYAPLQGDSYVVKNVRQIRSGKQDGKAGFSEEWRGFLYPRETGTLEIGPLAVSYTEPNEEEDIFSLFFSSAAEKIARGKPAKLTVIPLPKTDKNVQAVGSFTEFTASINKTSAPQHEAVRLMLNLSGDADFEHIEVPQLTLPEGLRSYESQTLTTEKGVSWVYLVQGFEEGSFIIPAQEFVYFDAALKTYKTITTKPLELTVTPGKPAVVKEEPIESEESKEVVPVEPASLPEIPLWLFIVLLLFPPLYVLSYWAIKKLSPHIRQLQKTARARSALVRANKELEAVTDYAALYPLLRKALADYYEMPDSDEKALLEKLRKQGIDSALIERLKELLYDLNSVSRYSHQKGEQSLLVRTKEMLSSLKAVLAIILIVMPLHATMSEVTSDIANFLGGVPFIVWQFGVLAGWWGLWYGYKKLTAEWRFLLIPLWVMIFFAWLIRAWAVYQPQITVTEETPMYVGPADTYPRRALLTPQDKIRLVKKQGKWYYVKSTQGIGWVQEDLVDKNRN
jgi:hypothetical protein